MLQAVSARAEDGLRARVARIAARLEPVTGLKSAVIVADDQNKNAWVRPDRTIILTSGLISACASDDEIAFIIAHEASHVISKDYMHSVPAFTNSPEVPAIQMKEISADINGVFFVKKAGYNPDASIKILSRLAPSNNNFVRRLDMLTNFLKSLKN